MNQNLLLRKGISSEFEVSMGNAMRSAFVAAYRLLGSRDEAGDALQEACTRALRSRQSYDKTRPFYPWFYRILKNQCLDRLKSRRHHDDVEKVSVSVQHPSAEQYMIQSERDLAVSRAIEQLPADLKEIIELRHFQDLSYQEMALILECPEGTVMSRLYRARKKVREHLLKDPKAGFNLKPGRRKK